MQELNVAVVAIKKDDYYYMQHRSGNPSIGAANLIGFFGGKVENETPRAAAFRELGEETSLILANEKILYEIGAVKVISDYKLKTTAVKITAFGYDLPANKELHAKEGSIVSMTVTEAIANRNKLTPGTRAIFEELITEEKTKNV